MKHFYFFSTNLLLHLLEYLKKFQVMEIAFMHLFILGILPKALKLILNLLLKE